MVYSLLYSAAKLGYNTNSAKIKNIREWVLWGPEAITNVIQDRGNDETLAKAKTVLASHSQGSQSLQATTHVNACQC